MRKLRIADDFLLPIDVVTQRVSILGRTRSGKSHTAGVLVEEVIKAHQQTVIIDPKGDWWGLRSSADGKSAGLPITIMGGKHGDIPLDPTAGSLVADIVINEGISVILDLSLFESKAAEVRFMEAFLDRLYRKNEKPILLVVDEGDEFAPQMPEKNETTMLSRMERVCRRGAQRGIGVVLISQRSAAIHKGCLSQTELMVAHQTTAPQDRQAIRLWAQGKGTEEQQKALMGRLASLEPGMAVVWSPAWLDLFKEIRVRRKHTFDSGATPRVGARRRRPKILADVDLDRLKKYMAETMQKMKEEDPRLLREEIARLKADVARAKAAQPKAIPVPAPQAGVPPVKTIVKNVVRRVEVPALRAGLEARLLRLGTDMGKAAERAHTDFKRVETSGLALAAELRILVAAVHKAGVDATAARVQAAVTARRAAVPVPMTMPVPRVGTATPAHKGTEPPASLDGNGEVFRPNRKHLAIMNTLALFLTIGRARVSRKHVAALAGVSHKSSGYEQNVGQIKKAGYLEYGEGSTLFLTDKGIAEVPHVPAPLSTKEMLDRCMRVLSTPQQDLLGALHNAYPESLTREELAALVAKSHLSSGFEQNVGVLKAAGMAEYLPGKRVRRADWIRVQAGETA